MNTIFQNPNDNSRLTMVTKAVTEYLLRRYLPYSGKFLDLTDSGFTPPSDECEIICGKTPADFEDDSLDAVVIIGGFSRMKFRADRCRFVSEALRVLKPDGIFVFDYISPEAMQFIQHMNAMKTGDKALYRALSSVEQTSVMDDCRATTQEEIAAHARAHCADIVSIAAACSVIPSLAYILNQMNEEEIQEYIDHQIRIAEDIFVARYAIQCLCIFQKKPYDEFS